MFFFRYNKTKNNINKFLENHNSKSSSFNKSTGVLKIDFSSTSKTELLKISNEIINKFGMEIYDLEVVFCENPNMSISNSILVGLKGKLEHRINLVCTNEIYGNLLEYSITQKYSKIDKNHSGDLIFKTNIGKYLVLKMIIK